MAATVNHNIDHKLTNDSPTDTNFSTINHVAGKCRGGQKHKTTESFNLHSCEYDTKGAGEQVFESQIDIEQSAIMIHLS